MSKPKKYIIYNLSTDEVWTDKHYAEIEKSIEELKIPGLPRMTGCMLWFDVNEIRNVDPM